MLQPNAQALLEQFAARVRRVYPGARVWAFGSRVTGGATWESDLNVCVVLDRLDRAIRARISDIAWDVGFEADQMISTVVFSEEMFEHGPPSAGPLVRTILEEGVAA